MADKNKDEKPTYIPELTNKILKDVLTRPEESEDPANPRTQIKYQKIGRTAYKLDVYKVKTDVRCEDLKNRMNASTIHTPEWFLLRKQLLA